MKETLKLGGILAAITLIAALLLAGLNTLTAPRIAALAEEKTAEGIRKVLPALEEQKAEEKEMNDGIVTYLRYYEGIGCAVTVAPKGYGGEIEMMVGVAEDGTVTGVEILSMSETAGLGSKASEEGFRSQYLGKTDTLTLGKGEGEIAAISGATVTSKAVTEGVNAAVAAAKEAMGQ